MVVVCLFVIVGTRLSMVLESWLRAKLSVVAEAATVVPTPHTCVVIGGRQVNDIIPTCIQLNLAKVDINTLSVNLHTQFCRPLNATVSK